MSVGPTPGIGMPVNYRVVIVLIAAIVLLLMVAINVTAATAAGGAPSIDNLASRHTDAT